MYDLCGYSSVTHTHNRTHTHEDWELSPPSHRQPEAQITVTTTYHPSLTRAGHLTGTRAPLALLRTPLCLLRRRRYGHFVLLALSPSPGVRVTAMHEARPKLEACGTGSAGQTRNLCRSLLQTHPVAHCTGRELQLQVIRPPPPPERRFGGHDLVRSASTHRSHIAGTLHIPTLRGATLRVPSLRCIRFSS